MQGKLSFPFVYVAICCVKPERLAGAGETHDCGTQSNSPSGLLQSCLFLPSCAHGFLQREELQAPLCIQAGPAQQEKRGK